MGGHGSCTPQPVILTGPSAVARRALARCCRVPSSSSPKAHGPKRRRSCEPDGALAGPRLARSCCAPGPPVAPSTAPFVLPGANPVPKRERERDRRKEDERWVIVCSVHRSQRGSDGTSE